MNKSIRENVTETVENLEKIKRGIHMIDIIVCFSLGFLAGMIFLTIVIKIS